MTTDDRLDAILTDAAKMLRYQVDRLDEIHLLLDERLPKPADWENGIPTFRDENVTVEPPVDTAPDVDRDEALARVIFGDGFSSHEGLRLSQLDVARAAREHIEAEEAENHIEAEEAENHPVRCGQMIRDVRDGVMIAKTESWNDLIERAEKAEADVERLTRERDEARRGPRQEPNRWCPKMLGERLCQQQTFAPDDITRDEIGGLIALLDLHRPVGPDGKHGERHTPTCGCEDDERGRDE